MRMERYLITGATGYIGSMMAKHLLRQGAEVAALVRDEAKARSLLPHEAWMFCTDIADAGAMRRIGGQFDFVIHAAGVTASAYMVSHPVETADSIVAGTRNVLELARRAGARSMVYLSSMEVYGDVRLPGFRRAKEEDLGRIDLENPRSCYPMGKRMAEQYCYAYFREFGLPVKVARLAQTFGRGVPRSDRRVFAQFARAVLAGEDILLHTDGLSMGNYCAIDDAIGAILLLLGRGEDGEAYNIVNESATMRIRDMAELVAKEIADGKIGVRYCLEKGNVHGYAAPTGLCLSAEKISRLGWRPMKSLVDMYRDLVEEWRDGCRLEREFGFS